MSSSKSNKSNFSTPPALSKLKWQAIQSDLQSALTEWSTLESVETPKSPEEEQLEKMKSMIEKIKDKLEQF